MALPHIDSDILTDLSGKLLNADAAVKIEVAVVTALVVAFWNAYRKKRRLRSALKIEITLTSDMHARNYTHETRLFLQEALRNDPKYKILIFSSGHHVIIGNLTDDISYVDSRVARRIIMFDARARIIDDVVSFMKTDAFTSLPLKRKLSVLSIPFDLQDELQGLAMQLKAEL
ncbi:hypothetical protein [Methylobacterium oryzisoli]|uniref:hypothetical protein n=1 Tax=Methylobacterium oryzisoli TaxID=3385502 RepID=UPI0038911FF4